MTAIPLWLYSILYSISSFTHSHGDRFLHRYLQINSILIHSSPSHSFLHKASQIRKALNSFQQTNPSDFVFQILGELRSSLQLWCSSMAASRPRSSFICGLIGLQSSFRLWPIRIGLVIQHVRSSRKGFNYSIFVSWL